jgi:hypothetical protein
VRVNHEYQVVQPAVLNYYFEKVEHFIQNIASVLRLQNLKDLVHRGSVLENLFKLSVAVGLLQDVAGDPNNKLVHIHQCL